MSGVPWEVTPPADFVPDPEFQGAWATLEDGRRVKMPEHVASEIMRQAYTDKAKREADMPDEQAAIRAMCEAFQRLRELGWSEAIYCPKDGSIFDVIEAGSTSIHPCHYQGEWPTGYWIVGEGKWSAPSRPILYRLKPEAETARNARAAVKEAGATLHPQFAAIKEYLNHDR